MFDPDEVPEVVENCILDGNRIIDVAILSSFLTNKTATLQLTLTNILPGAVAVKTHGITPELLRETGVPLDEALESLKNNIEAAKGKEQVRVFSRRE